MTVFHLDDCARKNRINMCIWEYLFKWYVACSVYKSTTYGSVGEQHVFQSEGLTLSVSRQLHCVISKCYTAL